MMRVIILFLGILIATPAIANEPIIFTGKLKTFEYFANPGLQESLGADGERYITTSNDCGTMTVTLIPMRGTMPLPNELKSTKLLGEWCVTPWSWKTGRYLVVTNFINEGLFDPLVVLPMEWNEEELTVSAKDYEYWPKAAQKALPGRWDIISSDTCEDDKASCESEIRIIDLTRIFIAHETP